MDEPARLGLSWRDGELDGTLSLAEVANCDDRGTVSANTRAKIGIFARGKDRVVEELERLARDRAAAMGANMIVPEGPVTVDGRRTYRAFFCGEG